MTEFEKRLITLVDLIGLCVLVIALAQVMRCAIR
jgi:hypothetical protein